MTMSQSREKLLHSLYLLKIFNKVVSLSIVAIIANHIIFMMMMMGSEMSSFSGVGVPNFWLLNPTFRFLEALGMIVFLDIVGFMFHISWPTWVKVCNDHNPTFWLNINSYWHPIWHTQSRQCLIVGSHFDTSYVASQLFTPHRLHFVGKCVFWPR